MDKKQNKSALEIKSLGMTLSAGPSPGSKVAKMG